MRHCYSDYQTRDNDIVDYHEFTVSGCNVKFRGPGFDPFSEKPGAFFTCLGAAQTYGCFYEPFPKLLADRIGLKGLDLAVGGAAPGFYLKYPSLIDAARRSRFVILQAMAARQETNSRFEADGHVEYVKDRSRGESMPSATAWLRLLREEFDNLPSCVAETRLSWLESTCKLIEAVKVPVIFLWYSMREPDYEIDWKELCEQKGQLDHEGSPTGVLHCLWSDQHHMVDGPTASAAAAQCSDEARCISNRGMSAVLMNRHTGQPIDSANYVDKGLEYMPLASGRNDYYPSAEMHQDAAETFGAGRSQVGGVTLRVLFQLFWMGSHQRTLTRPNIVKQHILVSVIAGSEVYPRSQRG